jgi:hypothetical protein
LLELRRLGPEQLAQRIIDFDPLHAEARANRQSGDDRDQEQRKPQPEEAEAL